MRINRNVWQSRLLGLFLDVSVTWSSAMSKILKKLMCIVYIYIHTYPMPTWTSIQTSGENTFSLSSRSSLPNYLMCCFTSSDVTVCVQVPWTLPSPPHPHIHHDCKCNYDTRCCTIDHVCKFYERYHPPRMCNYEARGRSIDHVKPRETPVPRVFIYIYII